ncbi:unnamed protein product [Onchocerca ochengi]|uniref:MG2 domain-containing protein n=1 Tax=Onchocerca ochengi TaxID=42157 RepID=A0A182E9H1_ONCOC|nr:unnamed protein product [Onchocerca ochengi]
MDWFADTFYRSTDILVTDRKPLVVTQSMFRWNATNEVLITTQSSANKLVDISMEIHATQPSSLIFRQTLQAKIAGSLNRVKFFVPGGTARSDSYRLVVRAENDTEFFEGMVPGAPDLRDIYLQTDKTVYKPTDIVKVRALPLTTSGKLYEEPVDFALVNPDGFELIHKTRSISNNRFIAVEFKLSDHLAFGEWKIVARPDRQKPYTYSITFQVQKYDLSPFIVHVLAKETGDFDLYEIDVLASLDMLMGNEYRDKYRFGAIAMRIVANQLYHLTLEIHFCAF